MEPGPFVVIPELPPTANHIYVTDWRRKMRFLTKEAEAFKKRAISLIQQERLADIGHLKEMMKKNPKLVFLIRFEHFFPDDDILNKTFGLGKKDSAATRYKKMDIMNRGKLVEDALAKATDIDDSLFFRVTHDKYSCSLVGGVPQIRIFLEPADPGGFGL
jgi:hypothetical protein